MQFKILNKLSTISNTLHDKKKTKIVISKT